MEKKNVEVSESKTKEDLKKVLNKGAEVSFEINGEERKAYWSKGGYSDRSYYTMYRNKRLKEAENMGIIAVLNEEEKFESEKPETMFSLKRQSVLPSSIKVFGNDAEIEPDKYKYNSDLGALVFKNKVSGDFVVKYQYYDEESYAEIANTTATVMMIYLSLREVDNHDKKFFKNLREVESLDLVDLDNIFKQYLEKIDVKDEDLKNLSTLPSGEEEETSQKDTE